MQERMEPQTSAESAAPPDAQGAEAPLNARLLESDSISRAETAKPAGENSQRRTPEELDKLKEQIAEQRNFLYAICWKKTGGNSDLAEDLSQEALRKAIQHADQFKGENLKSWLTSIAINTVRKEYRTRKGRTLVRAEEETVDDFGIHFPSIPSHEKATVSSVDLERGLAALEASERDVLRLRLIEGLGLKEIAERLDITEAAVKSRLHRAAWRLRDALNKKKPFRANQGKAASA